jgi:uncharacterized protein (TIRG00374 family)
VDAIAEGGLPSVSWRRAVIRVGGSTVLLAVLFAFLPLDRLWVAVRQVPLAYWPATVAVYLALHLIGILKWRILVNAAGAGLTFVHAARAYYVGLFSNTFLPSVVGGDVVRAGMALRRAHSKAGLLLGSAVDRIQDVLGLGAVAGAAALMLPNALDENGRRVFLALLVVAVAGLVLVAVAIRVVPARRLPFRVRRKIVSVRAAVRALSRRPDAMAGAFLLGVVLQTLQVALNMWLGRLVGLNAPFEVWLFVWPLAKIAATLPLTQGGLGVREAAQGALFAPFGIPVVLAVATSLVFQVVILSGSIAGGIIALILGRFDIRTAARSSAAESREPLAAGQA